MNNNFDDIPTPNINENRNVTSEIMSKENNSNDVLKDNSKTIKKETQSMITFIKDLFKYITTHKIKDLGEFLIYVLIIAGFCIILSIPFGFLKELFFNIIILFGINFDSNIQLIFSTVWDIFYLVVAIFLFLVLTREKFYSTIKNKKEIEELKKEVNK